MLNLRSPQPKYSCMWDVQSVLDFTKRNWAHIKELSEFSESSFLCKCVSKHLTLKLKILAALTSASRPSSICHLNVSFMQLS